LGEPVPLRVVKGEEEGVDAWEDASPLAPTLLCPRWDGAPSSWPLEGGGGNADGD